MLLARHHVALLAVVALTATAGCTGGVLGGDGPIENSASPVGVSDSALEEANFEEVETRELTIDREVTVQDENRKVTITNYAAAYRSTGSSDRADAVAVTVVSTPRAETFGIPLNPVASMGIGDAVEFAPEVGAQFGGSLDNLEEVGSWEATVLDEETTVTKFEATLQRDGKTVDAVVHATKVTDGDDIVLVIAVYPQAFEEAGTVDQGTVESMFAGIEHETE
jgi:hypothetical protein